MSQLQLLNSNPRVSSNSMTFQSYLNNPISIYNGPTSGDFLDSSFMHKRKVLWYRLKSGFGKRLVFCKATIDPLYPLPD